MVKFCYTTAGENYDWFGSHTRRWTTRVDSRGRRYRLVAMHGDFAYAQKERYGSGGHRPFTIQEFRAEIKYGYAKVAK